MRRVRKKGGNKEKVFGCDLLEYLTAQSQEIPLVLRCCSEFVEKHGIVDGIYRLSGVSSNIQKLRGEFEGDGSPDLEKDVYLQDIHCVSSLCKAYFRELPNPLLTYQLYDKFAEAVAIQLEEERLVKIRDVLKELPTPHYRTLEFLMRHLVKMASYSSETNMHARNLAIVWAPNLLRSKDIEATGFNGTAAFMEVRVQSIVVEFILTHVAQLFPTAGVSNERRSSLPSPTAASITADGLFKFSAAQPIPNFGNISPGDGPIPIRPYHAIIEGTDKRKGSLKGRKWMSIFNIGGRFHDPRRRHKNSAKEKDRPTLRPARSMDSLSTSPYPNEGSRRPAQRPPSNTSPLVPSPQQSPPDAAVSTPAVGGSEYAVTYRRGTGLVSGGAGTQGTYTALDPEGLGLTGCETVQSRSPGLSTKAGRRAAMHITGPTMVTVPLHITSNLLAGVMQGGGADRVVHRGRERDGGDRVEGKEGGERKESRAADRKVEEGRKEEEGKRKRKVTEVEAGGVTGEGVHEEDEVGAGKKEDEEEKKEAREEERREQKMGMRIPSMSSEKRAKSVTSNTEEGDDKDALDDGHDSDGNNEYMDMKEMMVDLQSEETQHNDVFDSSEVLNSTEVEGDDLGLSGYVQDNFEFLDQMDFSVLDHMDCGAPYQVNEFSVEPPGHSDDEYEVMEQYQSSHHSSEDSDQHPETHMLSPTESHKHRPLSLDLNSRHTKSLSLPYMTSPVDGPEESSSEEEPEEDDNEGYCTDDEDMFVKSLPCDYFLNSLSGFEQGADRTDRGTLDGVDVHETSQEKDCEPMNLELPTCEISNDGLLEQADMREEEANDGLEEKETTEEKEEVHLGGQLENKSSKVIEEDHSVLEDTPSDKEQPPSTEESSRCCSELPQLCIEESITTTDSLVEKEEAVSDCESDYPPFPPAPSEEFEDFSVRATEEPRSCVKGYSDEGKDRVSNEGTCQELVIESKKSEEDMGIETEMDDIEQISEEEHEGQVVADGKEEEDAIQGELEDIACEAIKDEGSTHEEKKAAKESAIEEDDIKVEEMKKVNTSGEEKVEEGRENETDMDVESMENTEEKLMDQEKQQADEENGSNLLSATELGDQIQDKCAISKGTQHHGGDEVAKEEEDGGKKEAEKQRIRIQSLDKKVNKAGSDIKTLKDGKGGVGSKVVVSKQPKFYQVKAVPVVPPKPQHCKITAMTLRQQQKEKRGGDKERENTQKISMEGERVFARWQEKDGEDRDEGEGRMEKPEHKGGDRWRDVDDGFMRDTNRNSPLSMNFEEAVAIATMKREKERECEKEKERQKD
ncbi:uncharacterized protein LOC141803766 [Halichoeres trimaculatus]|uniref:uncharacterized protein LOC141803766 n=1 Tax=Halichoeres trimaculatus TaxID=147232 RepID=UPI003D9EF1B3